MSSTSTVPPNLTEEYQCVICLSPVTSACTAFPCNHSYDYLCLLSWLDVRQTCPLCNALVTTIKYLDEATGKEILHPVEPPRPNPPRTAHEPEAAPNPSTGNSRIINSRDLPRRRRRHDRPLTPTLPDIAVLRRRHIYRSNMRCLHVGSNRISRFRDFTPRMVATGDELQSRAKMFIRRELQVFEWLNNENKEFVLEYILAILKTVDLKGAAGTAEDMLADMLGSREYAGIFCHEIHAFLRSPYTELGTWDAWAQYETPLPSEFNSDGIPVEHGGTRKRRRDRDDVQGNRDQERRRRRA
ncbi:hypothetical protein BZA77DRAFT_310600 [Pyronema omphalodes]|nr:hypothetical protein BZA77DRAFT_310600 [Pyronema omphalodes]